jgi:large subunit ribosomal protein L9
MAQEVILMAEVKGLGVEGDVVRVAEGYARNFLLPRKLAAPVTDATRRQLGKRQKERDEKLSHEREAAQALAKTIEQVSCTITVKTGEEGKLFGSVTAQDVVAALKAQGVEVEKRQVDLPEAIRELGVFHVAIKLHPEIQAAAKIWVVEE